MNLTWEASSPLTLIILMGALSLLPFVAVCFTCFVKIQVVFALLRIGLGAQQVPSSIVTTTLAFLLSAMIMLPVIQDMKHESVQLSGEFLAERTSLNPKLTIEKFQKLISVLSVPLEQFLLKHSQMRERLFFYGLSHQQGVAEVEAEVEKFARQRFSDEDLISLTAAFLLSELQKGFLFGLLLFLPFLVIDLVVSSILVGMGMGMMSPATLALPLKLLVFIYCDSWFLITKALVKSYQ